LLLLPFNYPVSSNHISTLEALFGTVVTKQVLFD